MKPRNSVALSTQGTASNSTQRTRHNWVLRERPAGSNTQKRRRFQEILTVSYSIYICYKAEVHSMCKQSANVSRLPVKKSPRFEFVGVRQSEFIMSTVVGLAKRCKFAEEILRTFWEG